MVVTYLKIVLDWGKKIFFLHLRPSADGTRGTGGDFGSTRNKTFLFKRLFISLCLISQIFGTI